MSKPWTFMPSFFGSADKIGYVKFGVTLLLCGFLLSSCGPNSSPFSNNQNTSQTQASSAASPTATIAPMSPMSPPGADQRPPQAGQMGTIYNNDGLPALQPARGMSVENLFAENITDPNQRIQRVENAVLELRRNLDSAMPAIVRLVAVEKDMSQLVQQLQSLLRNEPPPERTTSMPEMNTSQGYTPAASGTERPSQPTASTAPPLKAVPYNATPPPAASKAKAAATPIPGKVTVKGLRIGEHTGKTRLVLDVNGAAKYSYDLDNSENLLVIELPDAGWSGQQSWSAKNAPLLASYTVQPSGSGSRLIIQLKKSVKVIYENTIKPNGTPDHRIVIDIAAQ